MCRKYYTIDEILTMKFGELPGFLRDDILRDIRRSIGITSDKNMDFLDKAKIYELDQFCNLWSHIFFDCLICYG